MSAEALAPNRPREPAEIIDFLDREVCRLRHLLDLFPDDCRAVHWSRRLRRILRLQQACR